MDGGDIALVVAGVVGAIAIIGLGFKLALRSQRIESTRWMQAWTVMTRVRSELFKRLHGPRRLQDQRAEATAKTRKRKAATPRRKGSRKPTR